MDRAGWATLWTIHTFIRYGEILNQTIAIFLSSRQKFRNTKHIQIFSTFLLLSHTTCCMGKHFILIICQEPKTEQGPSHLEVLAPCRCRTIHTRKKKEYVISEPAVNETGAFDAKYCHDDISFPIFSDEMEKLSNTACNKDRDNVDNTWNGITYIYNGGEVLRGDRKNIRHVIVADSVTKIASHAFERCRSLETVEFSSSLSSSPSPSSLQEIGKRAFFECRSLRIAILPPSVQRIGEMSFCYCENLESPIVSSPVSSSSLRIIGKDAYYQCKSLTSIEFPSTLETIGARAFGLCNKLISVKFSKDSPMEETANGCFRSCENLKTVMLPDHIKVLAKNSFSACTRLSSIHLPDSLEIINDEVFSFCYSLASIDIPSGVKDIGACAFRYCQFKSIELPDQVQTISHSTFFGCHSLERVQLPCSIQTIQRSAFYKCTKLTSIGYSATTSTGEASIDEDGYVWNKAKATVRIPNSIQTIALNSFDGCHGLNGLVNRHVVHYISDVPTARQFLQISDRCPLSFRPYILSLRPFLAGTKDQDGKLLDEEQRVRHSNYVYHLLLRDGAMWEQQQHQQKPEQNQ